MGRIDEAMRRAAERTTEPTVAFPQPAAGVLPATFAAESSGASESQPADGPPTGVAGDRLLDDKARHMPARIAAFNPAFVERLVIAPKPHPGLVEQFRGLAAALLRAHQASSLKTVMVTSANPNEGKTLTAVNLSLILSESYGRQVLLVDADLRRPSIREIADISNHSGLSEALKAKSDQRLTVLPLTERLTLLPAGRPDPDPLSGLSSPRMRRIITEAAARFDFVILDAPPVGPIPDAGLLVSMVDTTVLVVRGGRTVYAQGQRAIESVGRERIFGVVLNGAEDAAKNPTYPGYYSPRSTARA